MTQMIDATMLSRDLEYAYELEVDSVIQMKTVYGVVGKSGERFVWKFIDEGNPLTRLSNMQSVFDRLRREKFQIAAPIETKRGALALKLADGRVGYLQPWLRGGAICFADKDDRDRTVRTIGKMHRATQELDLRSRSFPADTFLYEKLIAKRQLLKKVWKDAARRLPKLRRVEANIFRRMDDAIRGTKVSFPGRSSQFPRLTLPNFYTFCHRDLAPHNLVSVDGAVGVGLIDFDHAGLDDPFHDVMQISNHVVFVSDISANHFRDIVDGYLEECPQSPQRTEVLWQLLRFPDILCRSIMEWGKLGFPREYQVRVVSAIQKEEKRNQLWTQDYERARMAWVRR